MNIRKHGFKNQESRYQGASKTNQQTEEHVATRKEQHSRRIQETYLNKCEMLEDGIDRQIGNLM